MKLKNKKTGEIIEPQFGNHEQPTNAIVLIVDNKPRYSYPSIAEFNGEWEDYKGDCKKWWCLSEDGCITEIWGQSDMDDAARHKKIGNYFQTHEEAEKAVERLRAWKRLKDKGFSFHGYDDGYKHDFNSGHIEFYVENSGDVLVDLDILFGGEE